MSGGTSVALLPQSPDGALAGPEVTAIAWRERSEELGVGG